MEVQLRRLGPNPKIKSLKVPKECRTKIWLAGRGTSCQIYTKSKFASRQHFSITYRDRQYFILDLQSANGTFVNDEKLTHEKILTFGSIISVGVPSEMQNSPDCIVYIFEPCSELLVNEKQLISSNNDNFDISNTKEDSSVKQLSKSKSPEKMDVDLPRNEEIEKTKPPDSPSSDVILIEPDPPQVGPTPPKLRRLENCIKVEEEPTNTEEEEPINTEEEDKDAYEALTQVDEPTVKVEPELLNYSLTEELIEISDSEDDWSHPEGCRSPEDGDEDDGVVVLETIVRKKEPTADLPSVSVDELTETDVRWMGKLLKIKKEEERTEPEPMPPEKVILVEEKETVQEKPEKVFPCTASFSRLSTLEKPLSPETSQKAEPKKRLPKKSVTFNMVPQIRYFEVKSKPNLSPSDRGRMRFMRIIFNICNWNTHWLEECKKVAPDKDPPDLCEERLRKIPRKFSNHSDYMVAFIPAMLHHLWNKIKSEWVNSGESGFRQTVSCDSCEDYSAENLSIYKCTGLVQSVNAHKQLIREGHLVLLRLHQVQNPEFTTPASEKYSKKLGYLVFGFVETKVYERYHEQPLHRALTERCASIVGDLHVVRLTILVKKRPSFLIDKAKLIQLTVVHQISREIRMFKGICLLPDSPLCSVILKPTFVELSPIRHTKTEDIIFKGQLDEFQSDVVRKLSHSCFLTSSFLYSVHGPAGTGKGQIIIGLILQLLYGEEWKSKRPKIIYCSQWSIPLDETVVRLRNYRQTMDDPFSLVRVGPIREVKPEVRGFCAVNLAANLRNHDKRNFDAEIEVIKNADVICTTCISAGTPKICAAFQKLWIKDRDRKVICIMDDAMSCKETESVVPLLLGVTHFILFGDICQLEPTFSAEKTHSLGLDVSLFWRIYKNFINTPKELRPMIILKNQYRMNSSLLKFVSPLIYGDLQLKPNVNAANRIGNLRSHLLLLDQTPESFGKEEMENREILIVSQVMKTVVKLSKALRHSMKFAVIACDARQVESLQSLLPKREFPEIEIEQIQAFQGREFEMVAFVFDGRKITISWLATALTRARCSLFVFARERWMNANSLFRKMAESAQKSNFLKHVHPDMTTKEFEQIVTGI